MPREKTGTLLDAGFTPSELLEMGLPIPFVRYANPIYTDMPRGKSREASKDPNRFGSKYKKARAKNRRNNRKNKK